MNKRTKENIPILILLGIMAIFLLAFMVSETTLFKGGGNIHNFEEAVERQINNGTADLKLEEGRARQAENDEIRNAMKVHGSPVEYQFLNLTEKVDVANEELDRLLEGKGILEGRGDLFIEAQEKYDINVLYLISHAQLETGNGESQLAQGIRAGDAIYYNFFGVGAFDRQAIEEGSAYAARAGWSTPEAAILGGAKFIRENYLDQEQQTLYAMRWNPVNPGSHLYATDIEWALKIGRIVESHYQKLGKDADNFLKDYYKH
ncbi:N-acetylglucosaminidase [Salinicoccus bachuensis]|uniref:N-acetylglucosaminidase n=1 Tax=Salinicoccus bachuensis TaxID=3136731 RepID=A0ABZ3CJ79_9STAP